MAYLYLSIAILIATVADALLKKSNGTERKRLFAFAVSLYITTFYLLSLTMVDIPVSITYTTWSGIGVILTALVGVFIFKESLNKESIVSMAVIIVGVVLVNL